MPRRHQSNSIEIEPASQVIEMEDEPARAVKAKPDSSMVVGMKMLKAGRADGFFSAGNTGGMLAAAIFHLGRIKGVKRPALSTIFPTVKGHCLLLDVGANAEVKPEYLAQFGLMGAVYAERVLGRHTPTVGLVSNGEEEKKGTPTVQEAHQFLKAMPINFYGNVEGKDIPAGLVDVVVTDGFTGNVIIKFAEGLGAMTKQLLREVKTPQGAVMSLTSTGVLAWLATQSGVALGFIGGLLVNTGLIGWGFKRAMDRVSQRTDYAEYGGAPLLGVDGVVIIGHGRSNPYAIMNGVRVAKTAVEQGVVQAIRDGIATTRKTSGS